MCKFVDFQIIHWTSFENFARVMTTGALLTNKNLQGVLNVSYRQGRRGRTLGDSRASLEDVNFFKYLDEAKGVYLRFGTKTQPLTEVQDDLALVFSSKILQEYDWILNTVENNGFYIGEEREVRESPFSGMLGATLTSDSIDMLFDIDFDPNWAELVIKSDVCLSYLDRVLVGKNGANPCYELYPGVEVKPFTGK